MQALRTVSVFQARVERRHVYIGEVRDGQRAPSAVAMELLKPSVAVHLVHVKAEAHQLPGREPADVIALPLHVEALPRVGSHEVKLGGREDDRGLPAAHPLLPHQLTSRSRGVTSVDTHSHHKHTHANVSQ